MSVKGGNYVSEREVIMSFYPHDIFNYSADIFQVF